VSIYQKQAASSGEQYESPLFSTTSLCTNFSPAALLSAYNFEHHTQHPSLGGCMVTQCCASLSRVLLLTNCERGDTNLSFLILHGRFAGLSFVDDSSSEFKSESSLLNAFRAIFQRNVANDANDLNKHW